MAQSFAAKKQSYLTRLSQVLGNFTFDADALQLLVNEFNNDLYASGAANALTDADVQQGYPASTAALVFFIMGELSNSNAILAQIATARQAMETLRNS